MGSEERLQPLRSRPLENLAQGGRTSGRAARRRSAKNQRPCFKDGFIQINGEVKDKTGGATGEGSTAGNGDSGGPMFRGSDLIGVASGGSTGGVFSRGEASYVDLNTAESKAFLVRFGY